MLEFCEQVVFAVPWALVDPMPCPGNNHLAVGPPPRRMTALAHVVGADPVRRRSLQGGAMDVQGWPVHDRLAGAAVPGGVSAAAVSEAGDVADENLAGAKLVSVWAVARWTGHPNFDQPSTLRDPHDRG